MRRKTVVHSLQSSLVILLVTFLFTWLALVTPGTASAEVALCQWTPMSSGTGVMLNGVWGSSATDVFAVGDEGCILHYDGMSWSPMVSGTSEVLKWVWGTSHSDVFAVGSSGTILHYDGNTWNPMEGTSKHLQCVWGSSASDVFAVGQEVILHYDGEMWQTMMDFENPSYHGPCHIWGSSPADVFVVGIGYSGMWHYDGTAWLDVSSSIALLKTAPSWAVWGSSPSDVFVVGIGDILHFDGGTWQAVPGGLASNLALIAVWGSAPNDVFAVGWGSGIKGIILHYDGNEWTSTNTGTDGGLRSVWCSPSSDVFTVGCEGTILRYVRRPKPQIGSVNPAAGTQGQTVEVTITGTSFTGVKAVLFGDGITVNSLAVNSDTQIVVKVIINPGAVPGDRDVSVATPCDEATLAGGFRIEKEPSGGLAVWVATGTGVVLLATIAGFFLVQRKVRSS